MKVGRSLTLQFSNKNILIADLPLSPEIIKQLRENNKILIIDHHKTNLENMQLLPNSEKIFDMTKSGAMLVWRSASAASWLDRRSTCAGVLFLKYSGETSNIY